MIAICIILSISIVQLVVFSITFVTCVHVVEWLEKNTLYKGGLK